MSKKIGVVIPFTTTRRVTSLANQIWQNTVKPDVIVLVDNTPGGADIMVQYSINVIRLMPIPGVNASWEIGAAICGDVDYISFLNDDILIMPTFIERILDGFESKNQREIGAICPNTVPNKQFQLNSDGPGGLDLDKNKHPEGWAFTIRREIVSAAMPFPDGMIHFAGDNWLWWITYEQFKMKWVIDKNNLIHHIVGASQTEQTRARLKEDREICSKALQKRFPERHSKRKPWKK